MSLWSRESVTLVIAADGIELVIGQLSLSSSRRIEVERTALATTSTEAVAPRWQAAMEALERELAQSALPKSSELHCIIAGDLARYRIVPWHEDFAGREQRERFAQHCFAEAYGPLARLWQCRVSQSHYGAPGLACALDAALLERIDALTERVKDKGIKLVSVQPSLMHAFNSARQQLTESTFWFVLLESGWLSLLLIRNGAVLQVRNRPGSLNELQQSLDREWALLGLDSPVCKVYLTTLMPQPMTEQTRFASITGSRWQMTWLNDVPNAIQSAHATKKIQTARAA